MKFSKRKCLLLSLAISIMAIGAAACDTEWKDMTPWTYGPRCDRPTFYAIHGGDFAPDQEADIHDAIQVVRSFSQIDIRFAGHSGWRYGDPQQPVNHVSIEKREPPAGFGGYGWPGKDAENYFGRGTVWISRSNDGMPTRVAPGYATGKTYFGVVAHEAAHAFTGIGDMYPGHPGLLMGNTETISNFTAGDIIGMVQKGCRPAAEKANIIANIKAQYS